MKIKRVIAIILLVTACVTTGCHTCKPTGQLVKPEQQPGEPTPIVKFSVFSF